MSPLRGDLIRVIWHDTYEDSVGNPDDASIYVRTSYGVFWEEKDSPAGRILVTTNTMDKEGDHAQSGWCAYPRGCVHAVEIVKAAKRPRRPRVEQPKPTAL